MSTRPAQEQGFTLIELLIVSIIVGILATLVALTYSGVQATNRNARRQTDIQKIQSQLEAYYAQHSKYPALTELNDDAWRKKNMKELEAGIISDPLWESGAKGCAAGGQAMFAAEPAEKCYAYQAAAANGSSCVDAKVACAQYTLTAMLEGGEKYVKSSLN